MNSTRANWCAEELNGQSQEHSCALHKPCLQTALKKRFKMWFRTRRKATTRARSPVNPHLPGKRQAEKAQQLTTRTAAHADANQERTTCKWPRHPQVNTKGTIRDRLQRNRRNSQRHIAIAFILDTLSNSAIEDRTITVMLFGPVRLFSIINLFWYEEKHFP